MAFSVNKVTLLGNVTQDPELRYTPKGTAVCTIHIATNHSVKDENTQSGWRDVPSFHKITVWGKMGERAAQIAKGAKVYMEGRLDHRSYDAKDGTKRYVTDIVAEELINCSPKPKEQAARPPAPAAAPKEEEEVFPDEVKVDPNEPEVKPDDIPF